MLKVTLKVTLLKETLMSTRLDTAPRGSLASALLLFSLTPWTGTACKHGGSMNQDPKLSEQNIQADLIDDGVDVVKKAPWFQGSPEDAFAAAKADGKPVFLYWGAIWCPPCNEVKSSVFTQAPFKELMSARAIALYLDGDAELAQQWADRLGVSGYPTLLLLTPDGREMLRLGTDLDAREVVSTLEAVLNDTTSVVQAMERTLRGEGRESDWALLAGTSWGQLEFAEISPAELLRRKLRMSLTAPEKPDSWRARLAAETLRSAAQVDGSEKGELSMVVSQVQAKAEILLDAMFKSPEAIRSVRTAINYDAVKIIDFAVGRSEARAALELRWLDAADQIERDATLSVDTRLWAQNPALELALARLESKDPDLIPAALKADIQAAVQLADARAKSRYDRHAVIWGASDFLRRIGDFDGARKLLEQEAAISDTPWYYFSSLASLERDAGRPEAALDWATKARESAKGRASKVQWIVSDLNMTAKLSSATDDSRLVKILQEYWETALALPDGFSGRNSMRAKNVAREVSALLKSRSGLKAVVEEYSARCKALPASSQQACVAHFRDIESF